MSDRQLATITQFGVDPWTDERREFIRKNFCANAPDQFVEPFLKLCEKRGLSPEAKHIYLVPRRQNQQQVWVPQTSIDGQRLIAARTGTYAGSDEPVFLEGDPFPTRATVTVYRVVAGVRCPFTASAYWKEYVPPSGQDHMWKKMPHVMLAKVAESAALRKAFPEDLSGMYTDAEMDQAGTQEASFREVKANPQTGEIVDVPDAPQIASTTTETHENPGSGVLTPGTFKNRVGIASFTQDVAEQKRLFNDLFKEAIRDKDTDKLTLIIEHTPTWEGARLVLSTAADKYGLNSEAMVEAFNARTDAPEQPRLVEVPVDQDRLNAGTVDDKQMRTIFAIAKDIDLSDDEVKNWIRDEFGIESRKQLSGVQADEVIAWLREQQEMPH